MNKNYIRVFERQINPWYWKLASLRYLTAFYLRKRRYLIKEEVWTSREGFSIFRQIFNLIAGQMFLALGIVIVLKAIEHFGYVYDVLPRGWINKSAQLSLFTTLMQVSGALLGLYFTAISVVASTAYARAPGGIRSLVIRERAGHLYFRTLALLTGVTTLMATALSLGRSIGVLNTTFASVLCVFSIFGFVALGLKTFELFDPAYLVNYLNQQLAKSINAVTPVAPYFSDPSFQNHHRKVAEEHLGNYESLITLASSEDNLDRKALVKLGAGLFTLLRFYATQKSTISTKSHWFKREQGYKNWLLASHTEVDVALQTSTTLQPNSVPDNFWFERRICDIITGLIGKLDARSEMAELGALGFEFRSTLTCLGQTFCIDEGTYVFRRLAPCFNAGAVVLSHEDFSGEGRSRAIERLGIVDFQGLFLIELILNLRLQVEALETTTLTAALNAHDLVKRRKQAPYIPRTLIEEIEDLRDKRDFEKKAYGVEITPEWYYLERLAFRISVTVIDLASKIVELHEETFDRPLPKLIKDKNYFVAAQFVQRGLESCSKTLGALEVCRAKCEALQELDKSKDYKWVQADWNQLCERLIKSRINLIRMLSEAGPWLSLVPESSSVPDYFGLSYTLIAEESFRALVTADLPLFEELFPRLRYMVRLAADRNQKSLSKYPDPNIDIIVDPYADLLAISGLAAIYSELLKINFWKAVTEEWDNFLKSLSDKAPGFIEAIGSIGSSSFRNTPREMVRFQWKSATENVLREHGIGRRDYFGGRLPDPPPDASALLLAFGHSTMIEAGSIFLARYLFKRHDAKALKVPSSVKNFEDTMRHYQDRGTE